jgi:DNA polymerase-3 subunit delta'
VTTTTPAAAPAAGVWTDVVGQQDAVEQLRETVRRASAEGGGTAPAHAWLFTGPPGSGRSTAARAFAAALQCEQGGCGTCHSCRTVMAGSHPDVLVTATETSIISTEMARDLIQQAQRRPSIGRWRVMLVEDADRLHERAENALLKAIEEPPPRTIWLLCAPSPEDVLVTVRSRSRPVRLRVPSAEAVTELLVKRGADPAVAAFAARAAQNHVGRAYRLATDDDARIRRREVLDLAFAVRGVGDAVLRAGHLVEIANEEAAASTGDRDVREKAALLRALGYEGESRLPPPIRAQVRAMEAEQKKRANRFRRDAVDRAMLDLLSVYRDVLVVQIGAQVDLVNGAERDRVLRLARDSSPEATLRRMDAIGEARLRIVTNASPLMVVEAMAVQLVTTT